MHGRHIGDLSQTLERVKEISHRTYGKLFGPLSKCYEYADSSLQELAIDSTNTARITSEQEFRSLVALLTVIGGQFSDELEDEIEETFTRALSRAARNGELLVPALKILQNRYELLKRLDDHSERGSESWLAQENDIYYLVKIWPYQDEGSDEFEFRRTFWNRELRTLYRLRSSPNSGESILVVHDAGVDLENSLFVLILLSNKGQKSNEYTRLSEVLKVREPSWLKRRYFAKGPNRVRLWEGFRKLALGVELLHRQSIIVPVHRG